MANRNPTYGLTVERMEFIEKAIRNRSGWRIQAAAEECGRDERTIRRWVDALGKAYHTSEGQPGITRAKKGRQTFIYAEPAAFRANAETYDYTALALAVQMVDFAKDSTLARGLRNVKGDMERSLRLNPKVVKGLGGRLYVRHTGPRLEANGEILDEVLSGLVYTRRLRLLSENWDVPRVVEPLALAIFQAGVYVWVRSSTAPTHIYNLALQRITEAEELGIKERFEYPEDWNLNAIYANRFGYLPGDKVLKCSLRFPEHVAPYIQERLWHPSQKLEQLRDGSVRLRLEVENAPDFVAWICSFGDEIKVESPKELQKKVVSRFQRALKKYVS